MIGPASFGAPALIAAKPVAEEAKMAVDTQVQTVKFISPRYPQLKLIRVPRLTEINSLNQQRLVQHGLHYQFDGGALELEPGQDVLADGPRGEEQDAVEWLRGHRDFGTQIVEVIEPTPREGDFMRELSRATIALDDQAVRDLIEMESDGFKRANLLEAAGNALTLIEEAQEGDGPASGEAD